MASWNPINPQAAPISQATSKEEATQAASDTISAGTASTRKISVQEKP